MAGECPRGCGRSVGGVAEITIDIGEQIVTEASSPTESVGSRQPNGLSSLQQGPNGPRRAEPGGKASPIGDFAYVTYLAGIEELEMMTSTIERANRGEPDDELSHRRR